MAERADLVDEAMALIALAITVTVTQYLIYGEIELLLWFDFFFSVVVFSFVLSLSVAAYLSRAMQAGWFWLSVSFIPLWFVVLWYDDTFFFAFLIQTAVTMFFITRLYYEQWIRGMK